MNGPMNENQLALVQEYEFDKALIQKMDSINDKCCKGCPNNYFHTFEPKRV